ncbi:uncharacterized protein EV154DRAFT_478278 [Mucor mucedo]|uniref:uncharacterized protein n=1 Tax=Mucor mucedo TaxID=29922 RepID=UPI00221F6E22|nr:uncharacterized protein EV154DRAFT_478278 [Mucor mucedo]KAI7894604.1 hypothetical protein EV154DRAFT_478278 [Mucor mucedo]
MKGLVPHDKGSREHGLRKGQQYTGATLLNEEKKGSISMRSDLNQDKQFYVEVIKMIHCPAFKYGSTKIHTLKSEKFSNKNGKHNKSMDDFRSSLSSKQIPAVVIPIVEAKIEAMLRRNEVKRMSAEDIPSSVRALKNQGKLSIEHLINNYMDILKHDYKEQPAVGNKPEPISDEDEAMSNELTDFTRPEDIVKTVGKHLKKNRVIRKTRLNTYHKKHYSNTRKDMFSYCSWKRGSIISFVGNWSGKGTYIRAGHTRRSIKPILNRFDSVADGHVAAVDGFKLTTICSSCFDVTTKQVVKVGENRLKRIKDAVTCTNHNCPRRLYPTRRTTVNRDMNGASNIALIGFLVWSQKTLYHFHLFEEVLITQTNGRNIPLYENWMIIIQNLHNR